MDQLLSPQGGDIYNPHNPPRWPRYIGALALDAWLARVAAYEPTQPPSVELCIAQYPVEEVQPDAVEMLNIEAIQLPLHLQWGNEVVPADLCQSPLTPTDADATRRMLATAVNIYSGRTALFALYGQLDEKAYSAMETRLRTGTRLLPRAQLRSVHGQYPNRGVIEACGVAVAGNTSRALVARLERKRRRWLGTVLRVV
jgi:uncharacterized protein DUF6459